MQQKPNEVQTWAPAWWHNRRDDLRRADRTIVLIGNTPPHCLLCGQSVPFGPEARDQHHRQHMAELDSWLNGQPPEPTDSERRARSRREQRQHEITRPGRSASTPTCTPSRASTRRPTIGSDSVDSATRRRRPRPASATSTSRG